MAASAAAATAADAATRRPGPGARPEKLPNGIRLGGVELTTNRGHILESRCALGESESCSVDDPSAQICDFCRYDKRLKVPLPDEVFAQNHLTIRHLATGACLTFNAFDALAGVDPENDHIKVACAQEWAAGRTVVHDVVKPFDWTYTTEYKGSADSQSWTIEPTEERIDIEALKRREPILFQDSIFLYLDDFGDNGQVVMNVRVRVMPSSLFVLQRLFVRVDKVLVRMYDTRVYHRFGSDGLIREYTARESSVKDLEAAHATKGMSLAMMYRNDQVHLLEPLLPIKMQLVEKLVPVPKPA